MGRFSGCIRSVYFLPLFDGTVSETETSFGRMTGESTDDAMKEGNMKGMEGNIIYIAVVTDCESMTNRKLS
jgi:hypothetical protein